MFSVLMPYACSKEAAQVREEGAIIYPSLHVRVSEMTMCAETRALSPMSPDIEKYVTTLAVFEFDKEGLHTKKNSTYHFIDFLKGTVDGEEGVGGIKRTEFGVVEFNLEGIPFEERNNGTICLVANVTEKRVIDFYTSCSNKTGGESFGHITLSQFQNWALPFNYKKSTSDKYDESVSGHLERMYMFGYYEGPVTMANSEKWAIDLGRLASRLDITIVNETGREITERLGYNFNNVCDSAYFFPMKKSPSASKNGQTRTVICAGSRLETIETAPGTKIPVTFAKDSTHTRYFYVAAHSAKDENEATKLHLYYNSHINATEDGKPDPDGQDYLVPLCNIHPSYAASVANGYSLSRNTRYHFTVRLRGSFNNPSTKSSESSTGSSAGEPAMEPGSSPGEYIVYLP